MPDPTALSVLTSHWAWMFVLLLVCMRGKMLKIFPHSLQRIKAEVIQTLKQETQKWVENTKP